VGDNVRLTAVWPGELVRVLPCVGGVSELVSVGCGQDHAAKGACGRIAAALLALPREGLMELIAPPSLFASDAKDAVEHAASKPAHVRPEI
jgi:hypothetical protein